MNLNEEQITELEQLAGCGYTLKQIAMYFNLSIREVLEAYQDPQSDFRFHYERGKLLIQAKIDMQATISAQSGNLTAMQRLDKLTSKRNFINARDEMIHTVVQNIPSKLKQLYPAQDENTGQ